MSKYPIAKPSFWQRTLSLFGLQRSYNKVVNNPKGPEHGASWESPYGLQQTFSPETSMSAYAGHAYTHAAVSRASQDLASLPLKLIQGKGTEAVIIDESPAIDLLHQPNTYTDGALFREQLLTDLMLTGNCFILIVGPLSAPTSLFRLHPKNVRIVTSPSEGVKGYEYSSDGTSVLYPPERIRQSRNASWADGPSGELYGTGAIESLAREINADINAQKLASNASAQGRPDVLLSPKDEADIWGFERRREILDAYRNMSSRGGAMVLSGQVDVTELKLSPRDMEFSESRKMARESISAVLGVPSTVLGLPDANYATAKQSTMNYWSVQTKRGAKMSLLFTSIVKLFNPDYRIEHDYSGIEALQSVRDAQLMRIEKHILNGLSPADAYRYEGLEDSPLIIENRESNAEDLGDEEHQDTRSLIRLLSFETKSEEDELAKVGNKREAFDELPEPTQLALERKATKHNEEVNQAASKKTSKFTLAVVYWRGIGAYKENPASVRPNVNSAEQWAMGRVNSYLRALKNGRFRSGKHDTDLLPDDHPMSDQKKKSFETRGSVGDKDPTNFPNDGDNLQVSLNNSEYRLFPLGYAQDLKDNWPEIWNKGGNILGNTQFNRLMPIAKRENRKATTTTEEKAIRLREAWMARHLRDFRLAGVVAQIKWLGIGSRGTDHMRNVIEAEKKKINEKRERRDFWHAEVERNIKPIERRMQRVVKKYLSDASARYEERIRLQLNNNKTVQIQKAIFDWAEILATSLEYGYVLESIGEFQSAMWELSTRGAMRELYQLAGIAMPDALVDTVQVRNQVIQQMARQITDTTSKSVQIWVMDGIASGNSVDEIADGVRSITGFSEGRSKTIAQTETGKTLNLARQATWEQISSDQGITVQKQWIASRDEKVRDEHEILDGQIVGLNEEFTVGTYHSLSPSGFGVEKMDINCRCTMRPII